MVVFSKGGGGDKSGMLILNIERLINTCLISMHCSTCTRKEYLWKFYIRKIVSRFFNKLIFCTSVPQLSI